MKNIMDDLKKIAIGHHFAVGSSDLHMALIKAYERGFNDSKNASLSTVKEHVKDPTVQSLLVKTLEENYSMYEYLNR